MKNDLTVIHRLLDGGLSEEERTRLLRQVQADPVLSKEYQIMTETLGTLGHAKKMEPPAGFTQSVMARLPRKKVPLPVRIREFLFGSRVLRWNLASAVAVLLIAVVAALMIPTKRSDTVIVRLDLQAPNARQVAVAGDFNKWSTGSHVMTRKNGTWTIELPLRPGVYSYMFVVDNEQWVTDPGAEAYRDDGFGSRNAVVRVKI
jgi:anti-sigma factor RsiW